MSEYANILFRKAGCFFRQRCFIADKKRGIFTGVVGTLIVATAIAGVAGTGLGGLVGAMLQKDSNRTVSLRGTPRFSRTTSSEPLLPS